MTTTKRRGQRKKKRAPQPSGGTVAGRTRRRREQAAELGVHGARHMDQRELGAAIRARHAVLGVPPATSTPELYDVLARGVRAAHERGEIGWADAQRQLEQYARINGMDV